jgi:hypothetical protein
MGLAGMILGIIDLVLLGIVLVLQFTVLSGQDS